MPRSGSSVTKLINPNPSPDTPQSHPFLYPGTPSGVAMSIDRAAPERSLPFRPISRRGKLDGIIAMQICSLLPTPGSWSDSRSEWLPGAAMAFCAVSLFVATFRIYRRFGFVFKIQAAILWFIFGAVFIGALMTLYESFTFLSDVRASHV
jgi:hypothetical protein